VVDGGQVQINQWICVGEFGTQSEWDKKTSGDNTAIDFFYAINPNRSSGIRIMSCFMAGDTYFVYVDGYMTTLPSGEREIQPRITETWGPLIDGEPGAALPNTFGVSQKMLASESGLAPKGTRLKIWGKVVKESTDAPNDQFDYFYIDDGSGLETDQPGLKGIKVLLPAYNDDTVHQLGDWVELTGIRSQQKLDDGTIIPVFLRTNSTYQSPVRGPEKYTISGSFIVPEAAGRKAKVIADTMEQTECEIDAEGYGYYSITVPKGKCVISGIVPGYSTQVARGDITQDHSNINYWPDKIDRYIQAEPSNGQVEPGNRITLKAWYRDAEAKSMPKMPVAWHTDLGTIIDAQTETDDNGEATATLITRNVKEVATVWIEGIDTIGGAWVQTSSPTDPGLRIMSPRYTAILSGVVDLDILYHNPLETGQSGMKKMRLFVDGNPFSPCYPALADQWGVVKYPAFNTNRIPNGEHDIYVEMETRDGSTIRSNIVLVYIQNKLSELTVTNPNIVADQPAKAFCQISGKLDESVSSWSIKITDSNDNPVYTTSGTGSGLINCSWDGKISNQFTTGIYVVNFEVDGQTLENTGCFISATRESHCQALVAGVFEGDGWLLRRASGREMEAFGRACEHKGIKVYYYVDPTWSRNGDITQPMGMRDLLETRAYKYLYLTAHGGNDIYFDDHYRTNITFADGTLVMGDNHWVPANMRGNWPAFSDIGLAEHSVNISWFNVCYSGGSPEEEDPSFAYALGCRNDEMGSTFVGWRDKYRPLGGPFGLPLLGGLCPNGEGWCKDVWYYLGDQVHFWSVSESMAKANSDAAWDIRIKNWMFLYLYVNTEHSALVTWLVP